MKKTGKLIIIILSFAVILFTMAACGNGPETSDPSQVSSGVESEEPSNDETRVDFFPEIENPDIKLITHSGTGERHEELKLENGVGIPFYYVAELFEEKYGGTAQIIYVPYDQIVTRLINMQAANDAPDIIVLADQTFPLIAAVDALQPVDKIEGFEREMWDESTLEAFKFRGEYYGLAPVGSSPSINLIIYNKTMFEENMVDLPADLFDAGEWTFENFARVARELTRDTNFDGEYDVMGYSSWGTIAPAFAFSNGTRFMRIDEDGYHSNLDDPKIIETFRYLSEWFAPPENGGFIDLFQVSNFDAAFRNGKIAMISGIGVPETLPFEIDAVPFPAGPSNTKGKVWCDLYGHGIPVGAKNPIGTMAYLQLTVNNPELERMGKMFFSKNSLVKNYGKPEERERIYERYLKPGLMGEKFIPIYGYEFAIDDVWNFYWNVMVDLSSGDTAASIAASQHEILQATLRRSYGDID